MIPTHQRSPFGYYTLLVLSGGLFAYIWTILLARDINKNIGREVINTRIVGIIMGGLLFVFGATVAAILVQFARHQNMQIGDMSYLTATATSSAILLFVSIIVYCCLIYRSILNIEGMHFTMRSIIEIIVMTVVLYISFPFLQARINDLRRPILSVAP